MSKTDEVLKCGIVMPISAIDGCSESHWSDVRSILTDAIEQAGFEGNLVSDADDVGIIQKRIIQNLYENPVVVCDVSAKNPNVMFELGMRLAFDKPTIIVKDDKTSYSFDTSPIEHLEYPRDLRFSRIVEFKEKLAEKIKATHEASKNQKDYTTFLKHFGQFKVAKLETKEVSSDEFMIDELRSIREQLSRLSSAENRHRHSVNRKLVSDYKQVYLSFIPGCDLADIKTELFEVPEVFAVTEVVIDGETWLQVYADVADLGPFLNEIRRKYKDRLSVLTCP